MDYNERAQQAIDSIHLAGRVSRLYGKSGEVAVKLSGEISLGEFTDKIVREPLWIDINSIATPFFARLVSTQGAQGAVIALDDVDTDSLAESLLVGRKFYISSLIVRRERAGDWASIEGYEFTDETSGVGGSIVRVDENSLNPLIVVRGSDGAEFIVPIAEELIERIDKRKKVVVMSLIEGFFDGTFSNF